MTRVAALGILAVIVAGCATREGFDKRMQQSYGMDEQQLIQWAQIVPHRSYETDPVNGHKMKYVMYNFTSGYGYYIQTCAITFTLTDGKVTSYSGNGNACTM